MNINNVKQQYKHGHDKGTYFIMLNGNLYHHTVSETGRKYRRSMNMNRSLN